jgi:hypothetical protein
LDPDIYQRAKRIVYAQYKKHSAYRSGALVKKYKQLGGRYKDSGREGPLGRGKLKQWFEEKWKDVGNREYPVYRPTVRVNKDTPLTV